MSKMLEREIKNGTFYFPETWIELNPQNASSATHVVVCTDTMLVGVLYTNHACTDLTNTEEKEIIQLAIDNGFSANSTNLFGLIEEEYLNDFRHNVGNSIIRREKQC